jgi:hypothetical protein
MLRRGSLLYLYPHGSKASIGNWYWPYKTELRKSQAKTYARIDPQKVCRFPISSLVLECKENKHIEGGHPSLFVPLLGNKRVNVDSIR